MPRPSAIAGTRSATPTTTTVADRTPIERRTTLPGAEARVGRHARGDDDGHGPAGRAVRRRIRDEAGRIGDGDRGPGRDRGIAGGVEADHIDRLAGVTDPQERPDIAPVDGRRADRGERVEVEVRWQGTRMGRFDAVIAAHVRRGGQDLGAVDRRGHGRREDAGGDGNEQDHERQLMRSRPSGEAPGGMDAHEAAASPRDPGESATRASKSRSRTIAPAIASRAGAAVRVGSGGAAGSGVAPDRRATAVPTATTMTSASNTRRRFRASVVRSVRRRPLARDARAPPRPAATRSPTATMPTTAPPVGSAGAPMSTLASQAPTMTEGTTRTTNSTSPIPSRRRRSAPRARARRTVVLRRLSSAAAMRASAPPLATIAPMDASRTAVAAIARCDR